jgi:phosphoglycolate phosphatase
MSKEQKFNSSVGVFHAGPFMRGVIFDLDGTLIDAAPDLRAALNRVLAEQGQAPLTLEDVHRMIGDGAKILVERAFAERGQVARPENLVAFLADYEANAVVETVVYPGVKDALTALWDAGHPLAVCTNKPRAATRIILGALGLDGFFPVVIGGDSTPYRKPDPRHLAAAVEALGVTAAVMVGDHENDMAAARGLNIPGIFAAWGYGETVGYQTANSVAELPAIIAGL